jgi:hypothetical protein
MKVSNGPSNKALMKLRRRKIILGLVMIATVLLLLAFPFGPLLPWSPIKPGYHMTSFAQSDVYFDEGAALLDDYRQLDQMMREAEEFHQLSFRKRVKVVACKNWNDCSRALPWLNVKPLGGVTLATGDVIYITPKLQEKNFSIAEFLRHELSHALISQHISIRNSLKLTEQAWFSEGLAVWFGKQKDYLSREEFLTEARQTDLAKVIDPARMNRSAPDWSARFAYPAQRYFLEYLKQTYGAAKFQQFLLSYINAPDDYQNLFQAAFQTSLTDAIRAFQRTITSDDKK